MASIAAVTDAAPADLEIRGPVLTLRYATPDDAPALLELASDPAVTRYFSWGPYTSLEQPLAYIAGQPERRERGEQLDLLVVHRDDGPIGVTGLSELSRRDRRATVGSWFGHRWWGSGANFEAKALIAALAFEHLGLERLDRVFSVSRHRDVNAARVPMRRGTRPGRRRGLVVVELLVAEDDVVDRPLARRGTPIACAKRAEDHVDDATRGLDVAGGDRRRRERVDETAPGARTVTGANAPPDAGTSGAARHADDEVAGRARDRERAVEVPVVLRLRAGEVDVERSPAIVTSAWISSSPSSGSRTSPAW